MIFDFSFFNYLVSTYLKAYLSWICVVYSHLAPGRKSLRKKFDTNQCNINSSEFNMRCQSIWITHFSSMGVLYKLGSVCACVYARSLFTWTWQCLGLAEESNGNCNDSLGIWMNLLALYEIQHHEPLEQILIYHYYKVTFILIVQGHVFELFLFIGKFDFTCKFSTGI